MIRKLYIAATLLALCAACREPEPQPLPGEWVPLELSLSGIAAQAPSTWSRAEGVENLAQNTTVRVVAYRRSAQEPDIARDTYIGEATFKALAGGVLSPCAVDDAGNATEAPADYDLFLRSGQYDLYAITPALKLDTDHHSVDVAHGVDFAASLTTVKIVPQGSGAAQDVTLNTLQRQCANIFFTISRKAENVTAAEILDVSMERMAHTPAHTSIESGSLPRGNNDAPYVMPEGTPGALPYEYSVSDELLPKSAEAFDLRMQVRFNNSAETSDLQAEIPAMAFNPGLRYTFDIKLEGGFVILELQITPWNVEAVWETELGEPLYFTIEVGRWNISQWDTDLGGRFVPVIRPDSWEANHDLSTEMGA